MATVYGNDNSNWLIGGGEADSMKGLGGDDSLKGGGGADRLDGGAGIDTALYADSSEAVIVDLISGIGSGGTAQGDRLSRIENVYGSAYADDLYGHHGSNALSGLDGNDLLVGRGGADVLDGGYGDDHLRGGSGADSLNGGEGYDEANYEDSPAAVSVLLLSGVSGGDADGDTLHSIENVAGSEFSDFLWGDNGRNLLKGYGGSDSLRGFGGDDAITGGEGQDALYGMEGDDILIGDEGNDRLDGGTGADSLVGYTGADTFVWSSIDDTGTTVATSDLIIEFFGFDPAEGDRYDISGIDADVYAAGNQAFTFIGSAAFSGTPGEINYVHLNGETVIQMQTGTSTDIEGMIRIGGIVTPQASWFVL